MKIRQGFVSNSSTTSFCICGVYLEDNDLDDEVYGLLLKSKEVKHYNMPDSDGTYLGIDIDIMQPNETRLEFETRCAEIIKKEIGIEVSPSFIYDGWYNG